MNNKEVENMETTAAVPTLAETREVGRVAGDRTGWRPIETAPKDARDLVLLNRHPKGTPFFYVGRWRESDNAWVVSWTFGNTRRQPTHWMPLPDPPEIEGSR